jgi:hypothetical protein
MQRGCIGLPRRQRRANGRIHASTQKHHGPWFLDGQFNVPLQVKCDTSFDGAAAKRSCTILPLLFLNYRKTSGI